MAAKKGKSKAGTPHKAGYLREMLAECVFESEGRFRKWVEDNYTDAIKELGKLQPKNHTVAGDGETPLHVKIERVIVDNTKDRDS